MDEAVYQQFCQLLGSHIDEGLKAGISPALVNDALDTHSLQLRLMRLQPPAAAEPTIERPPLIIPGGLR